jgi:hypothetical protein
VGNAVLPCIGGRTAIRRNFACFNIGYFIRYRVEYSRKPVYSGVYTATQAGVEEFPEMAYYC